MRASQSLRNIIFIFKNLQGVPEFGMEFYLYFYVVQYKRFEESEIYIYKVYIKIDTSKFNVKL